MIQDRKWIDWTPNSSHLCRTSRRRGWMRRWPLNGVCDPPHLVVGHLPTINAHLPRQIGAIASSTGTHGTFSWLPRTNGSHREELHSSHIYNWASNFTMTLLHQPHQHGWYGLSQESWIVSLSCDVPTNHIWGSPLLPSKNQAQWPLPGATNRKISFSHFLQAEGRVRIKVCNKRLLIWVSSILLPLASILHQYRQLQKVLNPEGKRERLPHNNEDICTQTTFFDMSTHFFLRLSDICHLSATCTDFIHLELALWCKSVSSTIRSNKNVF